MCVSLRRQGCPAGRRDGIDKAMYLFPACDATLRDISHNEASLKIRDFRFAGCRMYRGTLKHFQGEVHVKFAARWVRAACCMHVVYEYIIKVNVSH